MKYSRIILIYIIAALASVYARTAQLLYLTEEKSGFFSAEGTPVAVILTVFMVLALSALSAVAFMTRRAPAAGPQKNPLLAVADVVLAFGIGYDAFSVSYITNATLFVDLTKLTGALSVVSLILFALRSAFSMEKLSGLVYLPIPLFFMFKLIAVFTVYATVSVIASNVGAVLFLCAALLFSLYFSKIENAVSAGRSAYYIFPTGLVASIIALGNVVPQAVAILVGRPALLHDSPSSIVLPAAFAVFSMCYVFSLYSKKNLVRKHRRTKPLEVDLTYHDMSRDFFSGE